MAHFIWLTDPHFNFLTKSKLIEFFLYLESLRPDGIFISGDISTGPKVIQHLQYLEKIINKPIYFVLGNHDYYRSSFSEINQSISSINNKNLIYLSH